MTLINVYTVGYYAGLIATAVGCVAIFMRTKCTPKELLGKRYNHYYQQEISSFISYTAVLMVFFCGLLIEYFLGYVKVNLHKGIFDFVFYSMKIALEFSLVAYIVWQHSRSAINHAVLTMIICVASLFLAFWHVLRLLDNVVFKTNMLDNCYSIVVTVVTIAVSSAMVVYAFVYIKPRS